MSRFEGDYEPRDDGKDTSGLWAANVQRALRGKRGRQALADLREALLALPEKRLIEAALCTVGIQDRIAAMPATVVREIEPLRRGPDGKPVRDERGNVIREPARPEAVTNYERETLIEFVRDYGEGQGEGVCLVGAYVWWQKVKAGMDPAEAFASLPVLPANDAGEWETADAGKEAGLAGVLAYELAYKNDEEWGGLSPEARYAGLLAWIERELALPAGVA